MVLGFILLLASLLDKNDAQDLKKNTTQTEQTSTKQKAFIVLRNNCNTCHATKRQLQLFTLYNMDSLRLEINTQVFITRKMPKGKRNQLSEQEEMNLKNWLNGLN